MAGVCNTVDTVDEGAVKQKSLLPRSPSNKSTNVECSGGMCQVVDTNEAAIMHPTADGGDLAELLGEGLEDAQGHAVKTDDAVRGKIIGLYFSAIWCPPCRQFSPILAEFLRNHKDELAVVYVANDRAESDMKQNLEGKPFYAIPFKSPIRTKLSSRFNISMIPTLVILTPKGEFVTDWGKSAVTKNPNGCIQEWKEKKHGVSWMQLLLPF